MAELFEELAELRAQFMIESAIDGFGMDWEEALDLLRAKNKGLTVQDKEKRDILVAAVDNLIEFAVAAEFQAIDNCIGADGEVDESIFEKYNDVYAEVEAADASYAMAVAAAWVHYANTSILTYMTQGDDRVRPWHLALEGISYLKSDFPDWLIPPIEHRCRCYLVEEVLGAHTDEILCKADEKIEMPSWMNPTFSESVCKGGRIFSLSHPYFDIPEDKQKAISRITRKIQKKWRNK